MTPCELLIARTGDLYPILFYLNFQFPSKTYRPRVKQYNNNNQITRQKLKP